MCSINLREEEESFSICDCSLWRHQMLQYANSLLVHGSLMALCWLSAGSLLAFLKFFVNKHGGHTGNAGKVKNKLPWKPTAQSLVCYSVLLVSNWSILHAQRPAFTIAPWHLFEQVVRDVTVSFALLQLSRHIHPK